MLGVKPDVGKVGEGEMAASQNYFTEMCDEENFSNIVNYNEDKSKQGCETMRHMPSSVDSEREKGDKSPEESFQEE